MKNKPGKPYIFGFIFAAFVAVFSSQIAAAQTCDVTWRKIDNPHVNDGDGRADVAIFRPSDGTWWTNRTTAGLAAIAFGQNGDKPTPSAFVY